VEQRYPVRRSRWRGELRNRRRAIHFHNLWKAFYDALATNDSAVTAMGDAKLKVIAAELITQVKKSVTIDWTLRESARARIKVMVKRILNKYGYPPDLQDAAVQTVLAQAELLCAEWV